MRRLLFVFVCLAAAMPGAATHYDTLVIALAIAAGALVISLVIRR